MTTLADFVTVTTRPDDGRAILTVRDYGYVLLGGAALYDLLDRQRLARTGEGRQARVVVLDPTPVLEPSLEYGFATVRKKPEHWPRNAVLRLGSGVKLRDGIYGGLVQEGVLGPNQKSGMFSSHQFPVRDLGRRTALIEGLRQVLLEGRPPSEPERRLAALLALGDGHCGELLDIVVDRHAEVAYLPDSERWGAKDFAKQRGMAFANTDWVAVTTLWAIVLPKKLVRVASRLRIANHLIPR